LFNEKNGERGARLRRVAERLLDGGDVAVKNCQAEAIAGTIKVASDSAARANFAEAFVIFPCRIRTLPSVQRTCA
jgi:hypothetical protein